MTNSSETDEKRLRDQLRVIDQSITMHAILRDRAAHIGTVSNLLLLIASTIGVIFAFSGGDKSVSVIGVEATAATWLGVLSVLAFIGTLVELVTDRRGASRRHEAAVRLLAGLKDEYRSALASDLSSELLAGLGRRYNQVMDHIPPVPEREFLRLKAAHLEKVEVSKELSRSPGGSVRAAGQRVKNRSQAGVADGVGD